MSLVSYYILALPRTFFYYFFRDAALRKFATDIKEDGHVTDVEVQDLVLNAGCNAILDIVRRKIDMLSFLSRSQLLRLSTTMMSFNTYLEGIDEEEEARDSLVNMVKTVIKRLGSSSITWTSLVKSEVEGIQVLMEALEGVPNFVENIVNQHLATQEDISPPVDENKNLTLASENENVRATVDKVLDYMGLKVASNIDTVQKLELLMKNADVIKAVQVLEPLVKDLKNLTGEENSSQVVNEKEEAKDLMRKCRKMTDIFISFPEFERESDSVISCLVCKTKFAGNDHVVEENILSRKFRNFKTTLVNHLESNTHKAECAKKIAIEVLEAKEDSRLTSIGLVLGCICYLILKRGRPYEDYTDLVSLLAKFGVDVGEINHSFHFVGKFRKRVSEVIQKRWKKHLSTRCPQTGCLPPVKVLADMATHQHWTRQAVGLAVLMPGTKQLIQTIILDFPRICKHDGESLAKNMAEVVDPYIKPEQYMGTSLDGAYRNVGAGEKLNQHFGVEAVNDWDPVHAAATIDTALRSEKEAHRFGWLNKITQTISSCNKFINWGAEWDRFFRVKISYEISI